jgi:putative DNA primase/helicase
MFRRLHKSPSFTALWPSAREIAAKLKGETRPDGSGNYACRCPGPSHKNGDANPSLSVKDGNNGRPVFFCHAGCDFRDIVVALEHMGVLPRRDR